MSCRVDLRTRCKWRWLMCDVMYSCSSDTANDSSGHLSVSVDCQPHRHHHHHHDDVIDVDDDYSTSSQQLTTTTRPTTATTRQASTDRPTGVIHHDWTAVKLDTKVTCIATSHVKYCTREIESSRDSFSFALRLFCIIIVLNKLHVAQNWHNDSNAHFTMQCFDWIYDKLCLLGLNSVAYIEAYWWVCLN